MVLLTFAACNVNTSVTRKNNEVGYEKKLSSANDLFSPNLNIKIEKRSGGEIPDGLMPLNNPQLTRDRTRELTTSIPKRKHSIKQPYFPRTFSTRYNATLNKRSY
ncbi:hypothetical protein SAMN05661044_04931 [Olivibacter domesticus]|uniref:Uncharacterized protein n=2 Tax=Olivibacter domesticus TaxID=407022 RepID=A0A1H7XKB0_OLID1|nr:hypothetical protein SAMN05661044_04931 [Olivibacter domesticus]